MADINFSTIPNPTYEPGFYTEATSTQPDGAARTVPPRLLIVGQKLAAGPATAGVVQRVYSADQVGQLCVRGSMIHQMSKVAFALTPSLPIYILPLADHASATKSTTALTLTGTATVAGELDVYVGGTRYPVAVNVGDTATVVGAAVATAVGNDVDRYADAVNAAGVVTFTARNGGIAAGAIPVLLNRYDTEFTPSGLTAVVGATTAGTNNPDCTTAIAALGDTWYPTFAFPYIDTTNLNALKTELVSRYGGTRQIEGLAHTATVDTLSNEATFAAGRNDFLLHAWDANDAAVPPFVVAAAAASLDANEPDPALPRQTLPLVGLLAKARAARRSWSDRNTLIPAGIATLKVDDSGTLVIDRMRTTYSTNSSGAPDRNYFDGETTRTLMAIRYDWRSYWASKYARFKLGQDGSIGDNVMTPKMALAEGIARYKLWLQLGWVEGGQAESDFAAQLRAQINSMDPNRLDMQMLPNLINGLRVMATQIGFQR